MMVAQGWEAHESFLFNVLATYLQEHEADADAQKLTKYREKKKLRSLTKPEEWGDFVRSAYRGNDNKELLRCLRALAPHLREGETTNNLDIDLVAWYQALAKVRHAVTHSWFKILPGQLRDMSKTDKKVLAVFFPGLEIDEEYELRMGAEEASRVLTILAEHAFLVFKGLSLKAGYDWDVLGKSRRITRAN